MEGGEGRGGSILPEKISAIRGRSTASVVLNSCAAEFHSANKPARPSQWTRGPGTDLDCKIDPGKRNAFNFYRAANRVL